MAGHLESQGEVDGVEHGPDRDYRGFVLGLMVGLGKQ